MLRPMVCLFGIFGSVGVSDAAPPTIKVSQTQDAILIATDHLEAAIRKRGYVSGIAQGSFVDKKTGAKDLGFGLHIMDFLLAPGWRKDEYGRGGVHGDLPKHYVEGPQICTKAKTLDPQITEGADFVAVQMKFKFTEPGEGYKAGSVWEQTLVFFPDRRYVLCSEQITCVNEAENLFYRIDMPGHLRHAKGDNFEQVYLSYHGKIAAKEFAEDFSPDQKFLYQRKEGKVPDRFIRAYQVKKDGKPGPWLAGMTLDPSIVSEAWCHQRGYICFIEELHGRKVKAGDTIGAAYLVGWFDDVPAMEKAYDEFKGTKRIKLDRGKLIRE